MKLRSTTPASMSISARVTLFVISTALIVAVPFQMTQKVSADKYDDQINALQQEIDAYNAQASVLNSQAKTLQNAVAALQSQAAAIQAQIDISQAKYDQLVAKIAETEKKIKDNQDALGTTIANMYVDDNITPLEMLAGSKNISDYMDKQEYRASVRDELTSSIAEIKTLKTELEAQKVEVARVLGDQQNSKKALVAKQQEQQSILDQTQGQEALYQQLVSSNQSRQDSLRAQQQAAIAAAINNSGGATVIKSGAAGGYPWNSQNCAMVGYYSLDGADGNGGDGFGYGCRQCVSYAAWRVAKETGYYPVNWGNATDVPSSARAVGYSTGYQPRAGSLAVMHGTYSAPEGHVVWVEAVNDNGTLIVSQYNYNYGAGWGMYSEMQLSASIFQEYVYIK